MDEISAILARHPLREFELRRLYKLDPGFGAICADYQVASAALDHWRAMSRTGGPQALQKAEDYKRLVAELEDEILAALEKARE